MDILAAIAADPTLLPLWAVLLFAAGMYPVGMMFGCTPCCSPCTACTQGSLPDTLTVAFSGIPETTPGPDLISLSFSSCFGSGASGRVTAPGQSVVGGDPAEDRGPISGVEVTNGGSGYARLGRAAPTVSVSGTSGSGDGATFNVTLATSKDSCGLDCWAVSKVTATGGSGYQTGDTLTFAVAEGDTQEEAASATLYAARVAPTVTVTGTSGSGTGATFDVALAQSQDSNGLDRWAVSKVTRTGGTGYADGDTLTFAIAEGDTQEVEASAKIAGTTYAEPTLSLSVPGGTGAVLTIDGYTKSGDYWGWNNFSDTWRISGITVANGGTGYTNNTLVTVNLGQGDEARPGAGSDLRIRTGFRAPNDDWTLQDGNPAPTGTGLVLSLTLVAHPTAARTFWVNSWAITNGGTGYAVGQRIRPLANEGNNAASPLRANLEITAVDGNGAVTALALFGTTTFTQNQSRGRYSIETGVITSVENLFAQAGWRKAIANPDGVLITDGGVYYREDENNRTVVVNAGGRYYREDASLPPYVATVTVGISQTAPSQGSGASISATVGSDPADAETFGKITGLTIGNGGNGYLAHELFASCLGRFNGRSIVVKRNYPFWRSDNCCPFFPMSLSPETCTYGYTCANTSDPCSLEAEAVRVEYRGPSEPMTVFLMLHQRGQTTLPLGGDYYYPAAYGLLTAQENVQDCSNMDITAYGSQWIPPEATAVITSGGEYEETDACRRITEEDMAAVYVDVSWGGVEASGSGRYCGWRSSVLVGGASEDTTGSWCDEWRQTKPQEWETSCSESRQFSDFALGFSRTNYCSWKWLRSGVSYESDLFCVGITRSASIGHPLTGGRYCEWCYPLGDIEMGEDLLPTGQVVLGAPIYRTTSGFNFMVVEPPAELFGNLLTEQEVCQNPGTPTITISSIP